MELRANAGAPSNPPASKRGKDNGQGGKDRLLEEILTLENLNLAYPRVKANGGSHGTDGMTVEGLSPRLRQHGKAVRQSTLEGECNLQAVRRVEIPKPGGGKRGLGIPSVVDRAIQQAIEAARKHIGGGDRWVVNIDLEKFFDRVNHDKLMSRIARKVKDKRVPKLIREHLEPGIMVNGVKAKDEGGTPQGGPLSPLLANIMLDELDQGLERRGHCRYADDCNIYVKSRKAGERVMDTWIERA